MTRRPSVLRAPWDGGSSAVELALILPILIAFLFGIIDFGRLQWERIQVTSAAFEGARASGQRLNLTAVTAAANAAAGGLTVQVTATTNLSCAVAGSTTTVTVSRPSKFFFYTPFLRGLNVTVRHTGAYRCMG